MTRDGYKGLLSSHDLSSGDEPITSSTLPIQMPPRHGNQRCASTATGLNGNGRFNGTGTAIAPVSVEASAGSRYRCR